MKNQNIDAATEALNATLYRFNLSDITRPEVKQILGALYDAAVADGKAQATPAPVVAPEVAPVAPAPVA